MYSHALTKLIEKHFFMNHISHLRTLKSLSQLFLPGLSSDKNSDNINMIKECLQLLIIINKNTLDYKIQRTFNTQRIQAIQFTKTYLSFLKRFVIIKLDFTFK